MTNGYKLPKHNAELARYADVMLRTKENRQELIQAANPLHSNVLSVAIMCVYM